MSLDGDAHGYQPQAARYHAERAALLAQAFQATFHAMAGNPAFNAPRPQARERKLLAKRAPTRWRGTTFTLVGVVWVIAALNLGCLGLATHSPDWLPVPGARALVLALAFGPVILLYRALQPPRDS